MGGINFSPILFILSKKLYLCIKQELFGRIATQFTEFMTVAKSLPRSLRNTYKLLISNSFLFIYRILDKNSHSIPTAADSKLLTKRMLAKYAGSWKDNRDSDEINDDIYASRLSRKEENFSPFDE